MADESLSELSVASLAATKPLNAQIILSKDLGNGTRDFAVMAWAAFCAAMVDGSTITLNGTTGLMQVTGQGLAYLTDVSTQGGPQPTDVLHLNRAGIDYKVAVSELATGQVSVTTVSASGTAQAITLPTAGFKCVDVTLTGNCAFTISGGTVGQYCEVILIIRGGAGGFTPTMPSGILWPGGTAPSLNGAAGAVNYLRIGTSDGGTTFIGSYY